MAEKKRIPLFIIVGGVPTLVTIEVCAKRFGFYRPTQGLQFVSNQLSMIASSVGRSVARISDIVGFVRQLLETLQRILGPVFRDSNLKLRLTE